MLRAFMKPVCVLVAVGCLTIAGCSSGESGTSDALGTANDAAMVDGAEAAAAACLAVDGSAHGELAPDLVAQAEAQANDRETAATALSSAAASDGSYSALSSAISAMAQQSRENADNFVNNPDQLAKDLLEGGDDAPAVKTLVAARSACEAAGLPTR